MIQHYVLHTLKITFDIHAPSLNTSLVSHHACARWAGSSRSTRLECPLSIASWSGIIRTLAGDQLVQQRCHSYLAMTQRLFCHHIITPVIHASRLGMQHKWLRHAWGPFMHTECPAYAGEVGRPSSRILSRVSIHLYVYHMGLTLVPLSFSSHCTRGLRRNHTLHTQKVLHSAATQVIQPAWRMPDAFVTSPQTSQSVEVHNATFPLSILLLRQPSQQRQQGELPPLPPLHLFLQWQQRNRQTRALLQSAAPLRAGWAPWR